MSPSNNTRDAHEERPNLPTSAPQFPTQANVNALITAHQEGYVSAGVVDKLLQTVPGAEGNNGGTNRGGRDEKEKMVLPTAKGTVEVSPLSTV